MAATVPGSDQADARPSNETRADNPDLEKSCGLDVLMILDSSGSIGSSGATGNVRDAFKAFTGALKNTSSAMAVVEFSSTARLPQIGSFTGGEYITITDGTKAQLDGWVDNSYRPNGRTNWEDALRMGGWPAFADRPSYDVPHLTVFITDGEPTQGIKGQGSVPQSEYATVVPLNNNDTTSFGKNPAANRAIGDANRIKAQQSHILAIGVGDALQNSGSVDRLTRISGDDIHNGTGTFDIATDDIYLEPDFDKLQDALRDAAFQLCAPSVTVQKLVDDTPDPDSLDDARPGQGWAIDGTVTASGSGAFSWVLPAGATGPTAGTTTNGAGFATFQWQPDSAGDSVFTATETVEPGYANDQARTNCTFRTPDTPDRPLTLDARGDGTFTITAPTDSIVTCQLVNLADAAPGITIEKSTNGVDADTAPGPFVPAGDPVAWTYEVTNTGNTTLQGVIVTDDQGVTVTCPRTSLSQGESMTCTATGTATAGQYANLGSVSATDSLGNPVGASDPSHYFGSSADISVEKATNGDDADSIPGPLVPVGDPVAWTYTITNQGNIDLTGVTLDDDRLPPIDLTTCTWGSGTVGVLGPNDTAAGGVDEATCSVTGATATSGQYENHATVTGSPDGGTTTITDNDPSHYFGVDASIQLEKSTNGVDADTPTGPDVPVGEPVQWTYEVTNTGNTPVLAPTVTDSPAQTVSCPRVAALAPGDSLTCHATGTAQPGQYTNTATATANDVFGQPLVASDPSHYFGIQPAITLEKRTDGDDADDAPGPAVPVGDPITWTYEVTNTGNVALDELVVFDSSEGDITGDCPTRSLAPGASTTCTVTGTAVAGQYVNVAAAVAVDRDGTPVGSVDPSHYFGENPGIHLEKHTNGVDADDGPGPLVATGDPVTWEYLVTNTGNDTLTAVSVTDDQGVAVSCPQTTLVVDETMTCTATGTATEGPYANVGTARGQPPVGAAVTHTDPSHYTGVTSGIVVEKATNGSDADVAPGPAVTVGDAVTWTYEVRPAGNGALNHVALTDDRGLTPVYVDGDDGDDVLEPGETWRYEATGTATAGQYANLATATGLDIFEETVSANDPSHYFGTAGGISIVKGPDSAVVEAGASHTWTITVTNESNAPLTDVEVTDDVSPACARTIGDLAAGASVSYECDHGPVGDLVVNVATVTGLDPGNTVVSDQDDARVAPFAVGGTGSIGDLVWNDRNGNQVQDPGEPGIGGARVIVTEVASGVSRVYVTDSTGFYSATGLIGATYRVEIVTASVDGSLTTVASYTVELADGEDYEEADFGVRVQVASRLSATGLDLGQRLAIGLALLVGGATLLRLTSSRRRRPVLRASSARPR